MARMRITEEDLGGLRGPRARAATKFWKENWWRMVSRPGRGRWVLQHHWRGLLDTETKRPEPWLIKNTNHSVHEDLRHAAARDWAGQPNPANLWGLAVFTNVKELFRAPRGVILPNLGKAGMQAAYQVAFKLPQPAGWLRIGRPRPVVFAPREAGSTSRRFSKFFAVDWGTYHVGVCREHAFEIFYDSAREGGMRGRYLISLARAGGRSFWTIRKPKNQTPIADRKKPEDFFGELRQKSQRYLVWSDGVSAPVLYDVRTGRAVREKIYPVSVVKQDLERGLVYGEVLVPNEVDAQDDVVEPDEILEAAHRFLASSRRLDYRHQRYLKPEEAFVVESWVAPVTFKWEGRTIKEGTWLLGVKLLSEQLKKEVATGELNAFSIRGLAVRKRFGRPEGGD